MIEEKVVRIDKDGNVHGGLRCVVDDNGLKLPVNTRVYAYVVIGEKLKPFNPSITLSPDGDVLKLPAHGKKEITVKIICGR